MFDAILAAITSIVLTGNVVVASIDSAIDSVPVQAERADQQLQLTAPPEPPPVIPTGLLGLPFAPEGLSNCDEMTFYRKQWGLPDRFDSIGWRESNCRNEDGVRTSCCHGYWQMWTALHMQDHRLAPKMKACGVQTYEALNSDTPEDKQRQACAAKALYDVVGYSAWSATS
jgi:hypothetical protein